MATPNLVDPKSVVFECIVGSRAYGLSTPESDTDIKGVYIAPARAFFGFSSVEQVSNETNDVTYYEIGRFFELLCKSNPTVLEMLFAPQACVLEGREFLSRIDRSRFISRRCEDSFARYAYTQIKKARGLNKKISRPVDIKKKAILDFCYTFQDQGSVPIVDWLSARNLAEGLCGLAKVPHMEGAYALFYDDTAERKYGFSGLTRSESSTDLALSSVPKDLAPVAHVFFNKNGYSKHCEEYRAYWDWVQNRNEARFETTVQHGKNYDSKNMMHTFRLLETAEEIAIHGEIFVERQDREELLRIKSGQYSYEELLDRADEKLKRIEMLFEKSTLRHEPDREYAENLLIELRGARYRKELAG